MKAVYRQARAFVRCLTLALFALRAAVPPGYMPDVAALEHGYVKVVICTGTGAQSLYVDAAGRPITGQDDSGRKRVGTACAFAMMSAQALLATAPIAPLPPPGGAGDAAVPHCVGVPPPPAQGPPLGPRAPPEFLG